ncbi:MAG: hypothetical protein R3C56_11925 [Pirellulaceae bacterium]
MSKDIRGQQGLLAAGIATATAATELHRRIASPMISEYCQLPYNMLLLESGLLAVSLRRSAISGGTCKD